jgi:GGDEF domain-containing protein
VLIDVAPADTGADVKVSIVATRVAEALLGGVRTEDYVARVGELRFAVLATEGIDANALAQRLSDHVRKHVGTIAGTEPTIAAAGVECQYDEMTRQQLMHQAETDLSSAMLAAAGKQVPIPSPSASALGDHLPKAS